MIRHRNIDRNDFLHPNTQPIPFLVPAAEIARFFALLAENSFVAGANLTLLTTIVPSSPWNVCITAAGTGSCTGSVFRVTGIDQFGKVVQEDISTGTLATGSVVYGKKTFQRISTINVVSKGTSATTTLSFGLQVTSGCRLGLPFRPRNAIAPGSAGSEILIVRAAATNAAISSTVDTAIPAVQFGATVTAGINWLISDLVASGLRP